MILGIDHVGVATNDADGAGTFLAALGMCKTESGVAEDYGVACEFWEYPAGAVAIETVTPTRAESSITEWLAQNSTGLYHIAFRVDDIQSELARLTATGFVAIDARPHAGARRGMRVAFVYAKRPARLVIELVQYTE